jgi:hypothetical protein
MDRGRVGEDRGSKETDGCPLTDTVLDVPTGNASRGILSIGKNYLSLRIPFTLLISNVICTY